ncbi:hypothetical protein CC1G_01469 [Coprinopsis cinerea okayama7|uniref:Uncharacterized protein n=1 Tax=Coprinopsis cinerea (strain Okayama-7 / 130 / ATCC MYA-4618 / FGSC 9003) TaxID=240176 RepID=A8NYY3_COPC7|nr:hypothetical protein CC1G_01469 [Coprinopsis cinerea okayama7\|eukprot:XP_001837557.2 hypothetical protein CC1G_01469 [Coprinopsis cinerea okayama7\
MNGLGSNTAPANLTVLIYPTGSKQPITRAIPAPPGGLCENLDLRRWFPNGSLSIRLSEMPGINLPFLCDYRLYLDNHRLPVPPNRAVLSCFGIPWSGNIVLARYQGHCVQYDRDQFGHITPGDLNTLMVAMELWLRQLLTQGLYNEAMVKVFPGDKAIKLFE